MSKPLIMALLGAAVLTPCVAMAHHSFAVFFDSTKLVKITGEVKLFRFANPHGTIIVKVPTKSGEVREWQIETNAPVMLSRRGWTRDTLKPGDQVTVEGWLARDGSRYLRLRQALDATGKPIGARPFSEIED